MTVETTNRKTIVSLSGGFDSAITLAIAKSEESLIHALAFRYGRRHGVENKVAYRIARHFAVDQHIIAQIDLQIFAGSARASNSH
jgi:7-cyano-7-deazaguanine synthase